MKRFQGSQRRKIKENFRKEPYFKLCVIIHEVFQKSYPSIIVTPEQLFADSAQALDEIMTSGSDDSEDLCKDLWTQTYNDYREKDDTHCDKNDTMAEVAMLFYAIMLALAPIEHSFYRITLAKILHNKVHEMFGKNIDPGCDKCLEIERKLKQEVNTLTADMANWMNEYFNSPDSLSDQISELINPPKTKSKQSDKSKEEKSKQYTLKYLCEDNIRENRIDIVRRKWEDWGWIEKNTDVNDFSDFFNGKPRDCNLKWTGKPAILCSLLTQLLELNDCFGKVTRCTPRSIIKNQFKTTYDAHAERIDNEEKIKIDISVLILNYHQPLNLPQLPNKQGYNITDSVLEEVYNGNMHITKDINKRE